MESAVTDVLESAQEEETLKEENRKLKSELRAAKRELSQRDRTISAMENNFSVKMNMFKSLAEENEKRQRFLTHIMRSSVDFIILLDDNLNVAYCSDLFLQKIGIEYIDEIEGQNINNVYRKIASGDLLEQILGGLESAVTNREPHRLDIVTDIERDGEYRAFRITHIPILEDSIHGMIINWSETTDIINAKNEAERASRSKSSFLASMSHEIRTPMNAILGIAQLQLQKDDLPEEYLTALSKIYNSGNTLLGIINDILDLSKIETGKMELTPIIYDMPSLINDAVQLNIVRIGSKPLEFLLDIDENLPSSFIGDELRLKQIMNNLLSNAIKYTSKGYVKLTIKHKPLDNDSAMLVIIVEDTGQGMRPEDTEKLFSEYLRFNTEANRTTEGTGIGLTITKNLVEMMEGTIKAESEFGKGSVFTVMVKQKTVECEVIGKELSERLRNFSFGGVKYHKTLQIIRDPMPYGKVLVVDDVETNLYVAEGLLSPYKLSIELAVSGFEAIEKAENGNTYDVIFMDHMMPLMDGIESAKKLRAMGYQGVIVALTANALTGNDEMFRQNGFDDFISKPIDIRNLNAVLNKYIRDRHPKEAKEIQPEKAVQTNNTLLSPKLIQIFCRDAGKAAVTLRESSAKGDVKMFTTTAHAMKSALANIGENELSQQALTLEEAGTRDDREFITTNTEGFARKLEALIEKLRPAETATAENADVQEDTAYLAQQLAIVKTACEDYDDTAAYAALDRLKEKQWKSETAAAIESIHDALYLNSDFEEAGNKIRGLMELMNG